MSSEQKEELLLELPIKWDIHGDLIMFPNTSFISDYWDNTKIERVQKQFLKQVLGCNIRTSNNMIRAFINTVNE